MSVKSTLVLPKFSLSNSVGIHQLESGLVAMITDELRSKVPALESLAHNSEFVLLLCTLVEQSTQLNRRSSSVKPDKAAMVISIHQALFLQNGDTDIDRLRSQIDTFHAHGLIKSIALTLWQRVRKLPLFKKNK